jgi:uncharacterized protein YecT (DUF1311 family)
LKLFVIASSALFLAANAFAGCENPAPGYDKTYCLAKLFVETDNELNEAYKSLNSVLSADQRKKLLPAQRAWIKYRNLACSEGGTIDVACNFKVNKSRTKFLLDRLTECKIGACKNDLLADENFDGQ